MKIVATFVTLAVTSPLFPTFCREIGMVETTSLNYKIVSIAVDCMSL
ncbi:hypothetical protein [Chamaesiphon sp. VAR_48_metabat_135_sub]|nr:hypothetical protein [Chamaesiphon sp. VAR_48_metabat_135_sub]